MYIFNIMNKINIHFSSQMDTAVKGCIGPAWCNTLLPVPYNRIYLTIEGDASFFIGSTEHKMRPGVISLIPSGTKIRTLCRKFCKLYWIHYWIETGYPGDFFYFFPHINERESRQRDYEDMDYLINMQEDKSMHDAMMRNAILQRLSASFLKAEKQPESSSRFNSVITEIENSNGRDITVTALARKCGMTPPYFSTMFKQVMGISPQNYILKTKINAAIPMLISGKRLDEIAEALGFHDAFHLSKTFKRQIGVSPRQYKERLRHSAQMP